MRRVPRLHPPRHLRRIRVLVLVPLALAAAQAARAQDVVGAHRGTFVPSVTAEASAIDTRGRPDGANGREGLLRVSPGVRWTERAGRLQGSLDYVADLFTRRGRGVDDNNYRNNLTARATAEIDRGFAYVDGTASITQQALSPFGQQSVVGSLQANNNQTELRSVALSPYVRGTVDHTLEYEARVGAGYSTTHGGIATATPVSQTSDTLFRLGSPRDSARLGWTVSATNRHARTSGTGVADTADDSRLRAELIGAVSPHLQLSVNAGVESIEQSTRTLRHRGGTGGGGFVWAPTALTRLSAEVDSRYVGNTGRITFLTRARDLVLSYTARRDTTFGIDGNAIGTPITLYQLLLLKYVTVPDPADRDRLILAELAGRDPNQVSTVPLVGRTYSLQTRQDLSLAFGGRRLSLTLLGFSSNTRAFGAGIDSPLVAANEPVVQHGYTSTLGYRLTPYTSISMSGTRRITFATSVASGNDLKSAEMGLTSQIGRRTVARISARYSTFRSATEPYREAALSSSLTLRF